MDNSTGIFEILAVKPKMKFPVFSWLVRLFHFCTAQATTSATGRNESFPSQAIVEMAPNDFIEMYIANATNANSLLVTELNVVIEALN